MRTRRAFNALYNLRYQSYALVKYIVDESENFSDDLFQCFPSQFAEDSPPRLEQFEIRSQLVLADILMRREQP
jgi:hypothetical protein